MFPDCSPEEAHHGGHGQQRSLDSLTSLMRAPGQSQHPGVVSLLRQRVVGPAVRKWFWLQQELKEW